MVLFPNYIVLTLMKQFILWERLDWMSVHQYYKHVFDSHNQTNFVIAQIMRMMISKMSL